MSRYFPNTFILPYGWAGQVVPRASQSECNWGPSWLGPLNEYTVRGNASKHALHEASPEFYLVQPPGSQPGFPTTRSVDRQENWLQGHAPRSRLCSAWLQLTNLLSVERFPSNSVVTKSLERENALRKGIVRVSGGHKRILVQSLAKGACIKPYYSENHSYLICTALPFLKLTCKLIEGPICRIIVS